MNQKQAPPVDFDLYEELRTYNKLVGNHIGFAFQTIIDSEQNDVVGFEALVRGQHGEPAAQIISRIAPQQRFAFDQACRVRAIEAAEDFGIDGDLHLNGTDINASNVETVVEVLKHMVRRHRLSAEAIVLELNNLNIIGGGEALGSVRAVIHQAGFRVLADNFGRRDADLMPIAKFQPDVLKIDRRLVADIEQHADAQAMILAALTLCRTLDIKVIASGVESNEEFGWLRQAGIQRFQGYFFAQPGMDDYAA